ncbi:MAG: helix-turn-helix transcriptional regulator [Caldimonas sp.]
MIRLVDEIGAARDTSRAVELLQQATQRMGAEVSIFVSFIPEDRSRASYRLLVACDPQLVVEHEAQAGYEDDPWLEHARHHALAVRGSELETSSEGQRSLVRLAERFGFRSSVVVPAPARSGLTRAGVLCFGSSVPDYFEGEGYGAFKILAHSVAIEFHEWWLARIRDELIARAQIDDADRRVLALQAEGRTSKQIARHLSVSIACVDSHFRRIRTRLDAPTRQAAARVALEYGLIDRPTSSRSEP